MGELLRHTVNLIIRVAAVLFCSSTTSVITRPSLSNPGVFFNPEHAVYMNLGIAMGQS